MADMGTVVISSLPWLVVPIVISCLWVATFIVRKRPPAKGFYIASLIVGAALFPGAALLIILCPSHPPSDNPIGDGSDLLVASVNGLVGLVLALALAIVHIGLNFAQRLRSRPSNAG